MIIKKWNTSLNNGNGAFEELYPKTKASQLYASDGTTSIFNSSTKIKAAYLPDFVFGGMQFQDSLPTTISDSIIADKLHAAWVAHGQDSLNGLIGKYFIAEGDVTIEAPGINEQQQKGSGSLLRYYTFTTQNEEQEEDTAANATLNLEHGDWLVITGVTGSGTASNSPYVFKFSVVNNTYQTATYNATGVVKLGSSSAQTVSANTVTSETARTYAIQNDGDGRLVVNVPWVDTNTTYSAATSSALGLLKVSATANTQSLQNVSTESTRQYAVQLDSSGVASVNVPWVDTNTTYSAASDTSLGLIKVSGTTNSQTLSSVTTQAGRQYVVQTDTNGLASVNVPWSDTNTTYTAGEGLTLDGTEFRGTYPLYVSTGEPTTSVNNAIWFDL